MFNKDAIFERMRRYRMKGELLRDAPLASLTSFGIGGPADILFAPGSIAEAVRVVKLCRREGIGLTVLGNGTNALVRDGGVRGIVMVMRNLGELRRERDRVFAGAGANVADVCAYASSEGLGGLEFACGIPGSSGGAVYMNAGAYGSEMKDVVYRSVVLDRGGDIGLIDAARHMFSYRSSAFYDSGDIILETEFLLEPSDRGSISDKMREYGERRSASQPVGARCAGSAFRRPNAEGVYVGPMIEGCGLKGARVGGAEVSEKHAGFIVNSGGATASDVLRLMDLIANEVKKRYGVELKPEYRILGEG
jgi:UDP-N-acetylmuramate dehydrogenase